METQVTKTERGIVLKEITTDFEAKVDIQTFPKTGTIGVRIRTNATGVHEVYGSGVTAYYRLSEVVKPKQAVRTIKRHRVVRHTRKAVA